MQVPPQAPSRMVLTPPYACGLRAAATLEPRRCSMHAWYLNGIFGRYAPGQQGEMVDIRIGGKGPEY